jgi:hypothetical protein
MISQAVVVDRDPETIEKWAKPGISHVLGPTTTT